MSLANVIRVDFKVKDFCEKAQKKNCAPHTLRIKLAAMNKAVQTFH